MICHKSWPIVRLTLCGWDEVNQKRSKEGGTGGSYLNSHEQIGNVQQRVEREKDADVILGDTFRQFHTDTVPKITEMWEDEGDQQRGNEEGTDMKQREERAGKVEMDQ